MLDSSLDRHSLTPKAASLITLAALLVLTPLAALQAPAQDSTGQVTGAITDATGAPIAAATVIFRSLGLHQQAMTATALNGQFSFASLPAGEYQMQVVKPGYAEYRDPKVILETGRDFARNVGLEPGDTFAFAPNQPQRLRVDDAVQRAKLLRKVTPLYPQAAKAGGIQGAVLLNALIDRDGVPVSLAVTNEVDPDLARSAVEAVSQWRYKPLLLNGQPVEVSTSITVNYTLAP